MGVHGLTLVGLLILILVVVLTPAAATLSTSWLVVGGLIIAALFIVVGFLPVIVGYGFRRRARWVRPVGIILAVLSMVNIPIGTALGIYTISFPQCRRRELEESVFHDQTS